MPGERPREILADLARAFPRERVSGETLGVYQRELADVPDDLLATAVRALIRSSDYFPTIRAIREVCAERTLSLPSEAQALEQIAARCLWARRDELERGDPPPLHPFVRDTVDLVGGFFAFRAADEPGVVRGQFLKLYREGRARSLREAAVADLPLMLGAGERKELGTGKRA